MAEHELAKLSPSASFTAGGVNRVGPGWTDYAERVQRVDQELHLRFDKFDPVPLPPRAPLPTEAERRAELKAALVTQAEAAAALASAQVTADRASRHAQRCREAVESFGSLEHDMKADLLVQLRDGQRDVRSSRELRQRQAQKQLAETDYVTAAAAEAECHREVQAALTEKTRVDRMVTAAVSNVQGFKALALVDRYRALAEEMQTICARLSAFDMFSTPRQAAMPGAVTALLREQTLVRLGRRQDQGEWIKLSEALLLDADTPLMEEIP
jgi:hypothetical protein